MFQFYTIHWTGAIFQGLAMTGHDGPSPESRDHGCIHMQRDRHAHTHTNRHAHFEANVFTPLSYENSFFLMTGRHRECPSHSAPSPPQVRKVGAIMALRGRAGKLINKSTINSFAIATPDKERRMTSAWEQETVGKGGPLRKLFSASPKSFILTEEMTKSTS